jgi:hypothetical protein
MNTMKTTPIDIATDVKYGIAQNHSCTGLWGKYRTADSSLALIAPARLERCSE